MPGLKRIFVIVFAAFGFLFLCHTGYIIIDGLSDSGKHADVAVILGNKVNPDGTLSKRLEKRLECGLKLYQNGRIKTIIVSGGLGKEGFYEGDKMRTYLIEKGIPDNAIVVDNAGNNTMATVKNTLHLQKSLQFKSVLVVSQYFHITRTKMLFKKFGFTHVNGASPHYFEWRDLYALIREFGAYYSEI